MMEESVLMTDYTIENEETLIAKLTIENNEKEGSEAQSSNKNINNDSNFNIEERYNKLRGFAIKLKKKVSDLVEQTRLLDSENRKLNNDKEELLNKILRMSDSAKKLQTIQSQYDQLQDDVELVKNENKRLIRRLENIVLENDSLKDTINKENKEVAQLTSKVTCLLKEKSKLQITCDQQEKKVKDLNNEVKAELMVRQQKTKECEDLKISLEAEIRAHKSTRIRLDDMKHDRTSNNVLSLEVANYEKSIESIKTKLDEETNERINLEATVNQHLETIEVLTSRITELQDSCITKTNRISFLEIKNQTLESDIQEVKLDIAKILKDKEILSRENRQLETTKKDFEGKVELLSSEITKLEEESKIRIKAFQSHVDELKRETIRLNSTLENSKRETNVLQEDFENYKLRAQSVLLKAKIVPTNELEDEIDDCKHQISVLNEKCENYKEKTESTEKENILLQGEISLAAANEELLLAKLSKLRQDSATLMEKYKNQETELQKLKINQERAIDNLKINHQEEIKNIRKRHEEEIENIKLETALNSVINASESNTSEISLSITVPEPLLPLIGREECEGSESTESVHQITKNTEQNQKQIMMPELPIRNITPLDQLLEFPFDEHEVVSMVPENNPELVAYKNRVKYLTELLADAERDIAKLTQLNQLLQEDIRRQKRYVEREKEAVNFEYLKNVVFKFVTLENRDERSRLVPVLDTILKLSPDETHKLNEIVSATGVSYKRSWIPGWNTN